MQGLPLAVEFRNSEWVNDKVFAPRGWCQRLLGSQYNGVRDRLERAESARSRWPERPHRRETGRHRVGQGHDQVGRIAGSPSLANAGQILPLTACWAG